MFYSFIVSPVLFLGHSVHITFKLLSLNNLGPEFQLIYSRWAHMAYDPLGLKRWVNVRHILLGFPSFFLLSDLNFGVILYRFIVMERH